MGNSLLKTTATFVALSLLSRLVSFSLNQLLIRATTPQILGLATLRLDVLRDTALFFIREGLRSSVVRSRLANKTHRTRIFKLPVYLSVLAPLVFAVGSFGLSNPPPFTRQTLVLYSISTIIELFAEPCYLYALEEWETNTPRRVQVDGAAIIIKAIATYIITCFVKPEESLLAFAGGQVAYSLAILAGMRQFIGTGPVNNIEWDTERIQLAWKFTKQSILKQLLTESDKLVVSTIGQPQDQGGYAIALNYGSLVARLFFAPLEESTRLFFASSRQDPSIKTFISSTSLLNNLFCGFSHLSFIFILASFYAEPVLFHLLGSRWAAPNSKAGEILSLYCYYLIFISWNGTLEGFLQSVAPPLWLERGNYAFMISSLIFGATVYFSHSVMGMDQALIYAGCAAMTVRIIFSGWFVAVWTREKMETFLEKRPVDQKGVIEAGNLVLQARNWVPKSVTLTCFLGSIAAVRYSNQSRNWKTFNGLAEHILIGALCGLFCLASIAWSEKSRIKALLDRKLKQS